MTQQADADACSVLRLRGLPFSADTSEVEAWFNDKGAYDLQETYVCRRGGDEKLFPGLYRPLQGPGAAAHGSALSRIPPAVRGRAGRCGLPPARLCPLPVLACCRRLVVACGAGRWAHQAQVHPHLVWHPPLALPRARAPLPTRRQRAPPLSSRTPSPCPCPAGRSTGEAYVVLPPDQAERALRELDRAYMGSRYIE